MTQIIYNGQDCFSGVAPTPLISQKNTLIKYGEQWGEITRITLNGVLTGYCANVQYIDGGGFSGFSGSTLDGGSFTYLMTIDGGDFTSTAPTSGIDGGGFTPFSGTYGDGGGFTGAYNSGVDGGGFYANDGNLFVNQKYLISNFSKDFQSLNVIENGNIVVNKPYCLVKSIDFPSSNYVKIIPFQIELDCYESGFFSGTYGILEPRNEFSYTQNKDQSITIEHTLSCRGFNTSQGNSNALQNARNYIAQNSGYNGAAVPYFIKICSGLNPCLISQTENINRVQSIYEVTEKYIFDPFFSSGVLRYTATYDSGIADGISNVRIAGSLKSCRNYPISFVHSGYMSFDSFSAAVNCYSGATNGLIDLNPLYLSSGVTIDPFAKTINFQIAFNNDSTPSPYFEYNVAFQRDNITDITNASINGTVKGRGDLNTKYQQVLNYYAGINLYSLTATEYQNDGYQYILNPDYISNGITKNPYLGEIGLQATYSDKAIPISGFSSLNYTVSIKPPIEQITATPILNGSGNFYVVDLNFVNREVVSIQGNAVVNQNITIQSGINLLSNYLNYINYGFYSGMNRPVLEDQTITQGNENIGKNLSFSTEFSFEAPGIVL